MYYSRNSSERCPNMEACVEITVSVDAEMGYGCSLDLSGQEYSCSQQETCGCMGKNGCLLVGLGNETM